MKAVLISLPISHSRAQLQNVENLISSCHTFIYKSNRKEDPVQIRFLPCCTDTHFSIISLLLVLFSSVHYMQCWKYQIGFLYMMDLPELESGLVLW